MAVTETLRALGSWGVSFKNTLPDEVWKRLDYFGHIAVHVGRKPGALDDSLLRSARYVGVLRSISDKEASQRSVGGLSVAMWLGDPDDKGDVFKDPVAVNGAVEDVIRAVLPPSGAVTEGTFFNTGETFGPSTFQFQSPRAVIDYVLQTKGLAWRVNGDATLDVGTEAQLFRVNPKCVVVRKRNAKNTAGFNDMFLEGLAGSAETARDVEDYTTGVLLLAQGINGQFVAAEATTPPEEIPFKDMHGNTVKFTRIVQESETDSTNAPARAQLQLNRFKGSRDALQLVSSNYDIKGSAQVGDYLWVYDPEMGLVDINNEVAFRAQRINPFKLRLTETSWPITSKMSVFYRDGDGAWLDLSPYVQPETGDTTLVVGGYNRSLTEGGSGAFPVTPPEADTSVPGAVEWDLPWTQAQYQSPETGESKAEVELKWFMPDNVDGSTILDGAYFEIRYRPSVAPFYAPTVGELTNYELNETNTVEHPISFGLEQEWEYAQAPFDTLRFRLQNLMPGMTYEAQVRAVDNARPANLGAWSDLVQWQASRDIFPPATPAAPVIASGPAEVLMKHFLGRADGGAFNLDRDLGHLELHGALDSMFTPEPLTLIGKVAADWGMITGEVPIVASFQITEQLPMYYKVVAVDISGNRSLPSAGVVATAELWGDKYISNLTVDKVTAGTISADWIVGAYIRTGKTGARVEMSYKGIDGFNANNENLLNWDSASGTLNVIGEGGIKVRGGGNVQITDGRLEILNAAGQVIVEVGECSDGRHGVQVYKDTGIRVARLGELQTGAEGMELIGDLGQLVRVDTLAFGTNAIQTDTLVGTTNGVSWVNIGGTGPSVNVTIGNSGRAIVIVGAGVQGLSSGGYAGYDIGGATTRTATYSRAAFAGLGSGGGPTFNAASKAVLETGLNPGVTTFAMRYQSGTNGTNTNFLYRSIVVIPY